MGKKSLSDSRPLRLAMLGMVDGNGHPYSWSAIFNGYDKTAMAKCPYSGITKYLSQQPPEAFGIDGARITHIWTDDPRDAELVSKASLVPHVVEKATDVIGEVDAVLIATDKGGEHVARAKPFVEAGIPIFVDKPLCDNEADLRQFMEWVEGGAPILSSSCMRYAKEYASYRASTRDLGTLKIASITMAKSWERYGIHALEGLYPILGPGFLSVRNIGTPQRNIVHLKHRSGADAVILMDLELFGAFGVLTLCGTDGSATAKFSDNFYAFKAQLEAFVQFLQSGARPFPFEETVELMKLVIAGIASRDEGGREVNL
jgi:predicted dehydrogenase